MDLKQAREEKFQRQRERVAAQFMGDVDDMIRIRISHLTEQCRAFTGGLPTPISTVDPRVTKFMQFMIQEIGVLQALQAKTFARLLDILQLELRRKGPSDGEEEENETAGNAATGAPSEGQGRTPVAADACADQGSI